MDRFYKCGRKDDLQRRLYGTVRNVSSSAINILLQKLIPEFPFGIIFCNQIFKIGQRFISRLQYFWIKGEHLAPMWPCIKRRKFFLNLRQQVHYSICFLFPCEVNSNRCLMSARAHPKVVCSNSTYLCYKKMRPDLLS